MLNIIKSSTSLLVIFVLFALSQNAQAAWVVKEKESIPGGPVIESTMIFGNDAIRTDNPALKTAIIMNFGKDRMYVMHLGRKIYMEFPISMISAQVKDQLEKQKSEGDQITTKRTGEEKKVADYLCEKIVVLTNGKPTGEIWVAKEMKDDTIATIYRKFFEMASAQDGGAGINLIEGLKAAISIGFPMKMSFTSPEGVEVKKEVVSITKKDMDKSAFEPPADFTKASPPGAPGPGGPAPAAPATPAKPAK